MHEPTPVEPTPAEPPTPVEPTTIDPPTPVEPTRTTVNSASATPASMPGGKRSTSGKGRGAPASLPSDGQEPIDIKAELELLARAHTALEAEDFARVLTLVQRHDREFPQGVMREEIAMLRVGALCKVGPEARWASARSRFEREFPGSPLLTHLREGCFP